MRGLGRRLFTWLPWLLLCGLAIPVFWPFYREGLPRTFDGGLHLLRLGLLDDLLRKGAIYPRWVPDELLGFGYPLFGYYAPASYYLAEALHLLGLSFYAAFVVAFILMMIAACAGMARLAWDVFGGRPWPTVIAALAYLYTPYLLTNTYIRGALAEVAAQALLPWILWSARRIIYAPRPLTAIFPLAFSLAALAVTHNITLLFTPPLLLGYLATLWLARGRPRATVIPIALALTLAMGFSAFFWLPLLLERDFIADTGFEIARDIWLPGSAWTPANFLDTGWTYEHTFARPIRLGLVQATLAAGGAVLARRRDAEWLFWIAVSLVTGLLMTVWALPLWQASDFLTLAQFTWRLLSVHSLALALLTGGLLTWRLDRRLLPLTGLVVMLLIVHSARPRLAWMDVFAAESLDVNQPALAQTEVDKGVLDGGEGNSSIQEFRPRWASESLELDTIPETTAPSRLHIDQAGSFAVIAQVETAEPTPFRFATFYFPGWRAWLNDTPIPTYPSTDLGLLTVDLPAGQHRLEVRWQGTTLQHIAGWISVVSLMIALAMAIIQRRIWPGLIAGGGLIFAAAAYVLTPTPLPFIPHTTGAANAVTENAVTAIELLGYQTEQEADRLFVKPYWLVRATPETDLRIRWALQDANGEWVTEIESQPYYNALPTSVWPPGTLVDDAYILPLPAGLPAGEYQLAMAFPESDDLISLGTVALAAVRAAPTPHLARLDVRFGDRARLTGYALQVNRRWADLAAELTVVEPGDYLRVHLGWQAARPPAINYHGFVHLVDPLGQPLVQEDQMPGPIFQPPTTWTNIQVAPDVYLLRLPPDAPGGIYYPHVGLYEFATLDRLPVTAPEVDPDAGSYQLPPIKVIAPTPPAPDVELEYQFGDLATLIGYTPVPATSRIIAGDPLTLTLQFRVEQPTRQDLTRFVQVLGSDNHVIAQQDSLPASGLNPTWSWIEGEVVEDTATLIVPRDALPGRYRIVAGLYTPAQGGKRLPVKAPDGSLVAEQWAVLGELEIVAPPNHALGAGH